MILYNEKVFDRSLAGNPVTEYTDPSLNRQLAQAEKWSVFVRSSQPAGTPALVVTLEHSIDNVIWFPKSTLLNQSLSQSGVGTYYGSDLGTTGVPGSHMRLKLEFSGNGAAANVEVWLCGRTND